MQSRRDGERRIHAHDAGIEVEFGNAFQAARWTFLDADAASFAVVDQNFVQAVRPLRTRDARLGTNQVTVVAGVTGAATEAAIRFFDRLLFRERLDHFVLRLCSGLGRQHFLLHAREVREVRHVHAIQIEDDVDRNGARLQFFSAHHFVEIECDALAVANRIDDHQRLAGAELHDIARGKEVRVAKAAELIDLDGAALVLEFGRQPVERRMLSDGDDDIVDGETCSAGASRSTLIGEALIAPANSPDAIAMLRPCRCRAPRSPRGRASTRRLLRACRADLPATPAFLWYCLRP